MIETESMGGFEQTMPVQATVIRLRRSNPGSVPIQVSRAVGRGANRVVAPMLVMDEDEVCMR